MVVVRPSRAYKRPWISLLSDPERIRIDAEETLTGWSKVTVAVVVPLKAVMVTALAWITPADVTISTTIPTSRNLFPSSDDSGPVQVITVDDTTVAETVAKLPSPFHPHCRLTSLDKSLYPISSSYSADRTNDPMSLCEALIIGPLTPNRR